jgi:hypothetical protein
MLPDAYNGSVESRSESVTEISNRHFVNVVPLQLGEEVVRVHRNMPAGPKLLNILDLYDAAFGPRVLWILHHRHVQLVLVFAEGDIGRAISCGDFEDA